MKYLLLFTFVCTMTLCCQKPDTGDLNIKITAPSAFIPRGSHGEPYSRARCPDGEANCNLEFRIRVSNPDGLPLDCTLQIFDTDGVLQFINKNIQRGWNGQKLNFGALSPQGTYVYLFKATNTNTGESKTQQGEFVLLR